MLAINADYHTHTINSHGIGTIRENVECALRKELKAIAISDHGPGHLSYGIKKGHLKTMRQEIDELQKEYSSIKILLAVEANLIGLDGEIDVGQDELQYVDLLLLGFHNGARPFNAKAAIKLYMRNYLSKVLPFLRNSCRRINTDAMIKAVRKYKVDILTHPGAKIDIDVRRLAKAAAERGTALEINSSHGFLSAEYAKIANEENVKFVIDSDAHEPGKVGDFVLGIKIAVEAGIPKNKIINAD